MFLRPFGSKRLRESYVFKYYYVFKSYSVLLQRYEINKTFTPPYIGDIRGDITSEII